MNATHKTNYSKQSKRDHMNANCRTNHLSSQTIKIKPHTHITHPSTYQLYIYTYTYTS